MLNPDFLFTSALLCALGFLLFPTRKSVYHYYFEAHNAISSPHLQSYNISHRQ